MNSFSRGEHLRALAALIFGACILGLASTLVRLSEAGPSATGFWRLTMALPLLAVLVYRSGVSNIARPSPILFVAGVTFGIDIALWHYGVMGTSLANANVLANLTPVVVTLLSWLFLRQRPKALFLVALTLALCGAWLLSQAKSGGGGDHARGDLLSAASCIWYAMYLLATGIARRTDATVKVMFWSTLTAAPVMLLIAVMLNEPLLPAGPNGWLACVGLGVIHVAGQGSIAWALGRLSAPTASIIVLVQPVVAAALGWLVFSEALPLSQAFGAALVLLGIVLAQRSTQTVESRAAPLPSSAPP